MTRELHGRTVVGALMTSYATARGPARAAEGCHPGWSRHLLTNLVRHYASRDASLKGIKSMSGNSVTIRFRPEHGRIR